nr:alpha/beta hydrolase [Corynebacterium uropygiale]
MSSEKTLPDLQVSYPAQGEYPSGEVEIYGAQPEGRAMRPVIVDIHGGGWNQDAHMPATLRWFADHGYLVLRPSYELATPQHPTADSVPGQVLGAYRWCVEHAAQWGGDPQRVVLFGDSAGGGLALSAAYRAAEDSSPFRPQAVVALYPTVDVNAVARVRTLGAGNAAREYVGADEDKNPEAFERASSSRWIHRGAPRTLIIQGEHDTFVPPDSVEDFVKEARTSGVDVKLVRVPAADHAFDSQGAGSLGFQLVTTVTESFLLSSI